MHGIWIYSFCSSTVYKRLVYAYILIILYYWSVHIYIIHIQMQLLSYMIYKLRYHHKTIYPTYRRVYVLFGMIHFLRNKLLETRGLPNSQFLVWFLNIGRALKPCLERRNEIQRNVKKNEERRKPRNWKDEKTKGIQNRGMENLAVWNTRIETLEKKC
jgi:hypothetical protein